MKKVNEDYIEQIDQEELKDVDLTATEKDLRPDLYQYMLEFSLEGGRLPQNLIRGLQQRIQRYTMSDSELMCFNGDEWRKFYFEKNVISDLSSSDKTFDKNAHHYCILFNYDFNIRRFIQFFCIIENFFINYVNKHKHDAVVLLMFRRSRLHHSFPAVIFFLLGFQHTRGTFRYFTSGTTCITNAKNALPLMFFDKSYIELNPEEKEQIDNAVLKWYTFH